MKTTLLIFTLSIIFIYPIQAAIYGKDNRELAFNHENSLYERLSKSVLSQVRKGSLSLENGQVRIKSKPLHQHVKTLCKDTPFAKTETFSKCTAFLVAPNMIVTAGHCINNQQECNEAKWVFSSDYNPASGSPITLEQEDLVTCKKILAYKKNTISKNDYALIEIEQQILHRPTLKYRKKNRVPKDSSFFVVGHPTGLPLIVTDQAKEIEGSTKFLFKIDSDTFGGNSGSPVINSQTGIVEGILTDGDLDYTLNKQKRCMMPHKCLEGRCKGENVVRITNIEILAPEMEPLIDPIFNPRTPRL
jgi:V8-like Glu-specific endopeptidase